MDEYCRMKIDETSIQERVTDFLKDRNTDAVTGIRRMGRDGFIDYMIDVARCLGLKVTVFPDTGDADILVFRHWSEMTGNETLLKERPNLDILFGQDLCHQVPAIVRNHGEDNKSRKHPGR